MPVQQGDAAPGFELPQKPGETVNIDEHLGREPVVLLFFPLAFSPVCTEEMCQFRDTWQDFAGLNAKVFAISVDSPFVADKFRQEYSVPFPVLSDFNKEVARQYGVLHEDLMGLRGVAKRSAFVIGRDGKVTYRWVSEDPRVQVPFDEVKAALQ